MSLTFDPGKNAINLKKHKMPLVAASRFVTESALVDHDARRDYKEVRLEAIGYIGKRLHVLVFAPRKNGEETHAISLRKANSREVKRYEKAKSRTRD